MYTFNIIFSFFFEINKNRRVEEGEALLVLSYPSELLGFETILKNLTLLFTLTVVEELDSKFIVSSAGLSSQSGSSGGMLLSSFSARPVGIIFAVQSEGPIAERALYSLTNQAIEEIIEEEVGQSLAEFLASN